MLLYSHFQTCSAASKKNSSSRKNLNKTNIKLNNNLIENKINKNSKDINEFYFITKSK